MVAGIVREFAGRKGDRKLTKEGTVREYERLFNVQMPGPDYGANEVLASPGLPPDLFPYLTNTEADLGALVRTRTPAQNRECGNFWDVLVRYSSEGPRPELAEQNPFLRPPEISWSIEKYRIALTHWLKQDAMGDWVSVPVENSAGETFDPPIEAERQRLVLNFKRNVALYDHTQHLQYTENPLNATTWYSFGPRKAKIEDYKVSEAHENDQSFWVEEWVIKMDEKGWDLQILDIGYYEVVAGVKRLIMDTAGRPVQVPQLLDGAGAKLAVGGTPVFLPRRYLGEFEFNNLAIPS